MSSIFYSQIPSHSQLVVTGAIGLPSQGESEIKVDLKITAGEDASYAKNQGRQNGWSLRCRGGAILTTEAPFPALSRI